jgi:hypothetical protein
MARPGALAAPLLILLAFTALALAYARAVPVFEASDEMEHFLYIRALATTGELPVIPSRADLGDLSDEARWNLQAHHAPLYYAIGALATAGLDTGDAVQHILPNDAIFLHGAAAGNANKWLHPPELAATRATQAVWLLRLFSLACGIVTLALAYVGGLLASGRRFIATLAMAAAAFIPTFLVISGSVTNDSLLITLSSAVLVWCLWALRQRRIGWGSAGVIALLLALAALTKITGLVLYGVVALALALGIWRGRGRLTARDGLRVAMAALLAGLLVAGWWYLRNVQLYGDPLAMAATGALWGRGVATPGLGLDLGADLLRMARTFWMMAGYLHAPVLAPPAYNVFVLLISLLGLAGLFAAWRRMAASQRVAVFLLLASIALVAAYVVLGTLSVDISYGRLLLPALVAIAALLAMGWHALLRRWAPLVPLAMAGAAALMPALVIAPAYPQALLVNEGTGAVPVGWSVGGLTLVDVTWPDGAYRSGDTLPLTVTVDGAHPARPLLALTLADPLTGARLGHSETYPGMQPTDRDRGAYRATVSLPLRFEGAWYSHQTLLQARWVDPQSGEPLGAADAGPAEWPGPVVRYAEEPAARGQAAMIVYGDVLRLQAYAIAPEAPQAGDTLVVDTTWTALRPPPGEWRLTLRLVDGAGALVAQADGGIAYAPTQTWPAGAAMPFRAELPLPQDLPAGDYRLLAGWYDPATWERLPVFGAASQDALAEVATVRVG